MEGGKMLYDGDVSKVMVTPGEGGVFVCMSGCFDSYCVTCARCHA